MTQAQFAQLLGVHALTISKWERGVLAPSAYQVAMMRAFDQAQQRRPGIGAAVAGMVVAAGIGAALYHILRAAFGEDEQA